jgi:hypothetical protein
MFMASVMEIAANGKGKKMKFCLNKLIRLVTIAS